MSDEGRAASDAAQAPDTASENDLLQELEATRTRADEHYRSWQRTAADFANFKRRVEEERRYAERGLLQDLLGVLDDFERAWRAAPPDIAKFTWVEGLWQIHAKLEHVLQRHGLQAIESAVNKPFDPVQHDAVMREENTDPSSPMIIVAELQRGYRLHERVLRPTLVKVGRAAGGTAPSVPPEQAAASPEPSPDGP